MPQPEQSCRRLKKPIHDAEDAPPLLSPSEGSIKYGLWAIGIERLVHMHANLGIDATHSFTPSSTLPHPLFTHAQLVTHALSPDKSACRVEF